MNKDNLLLMADYIETIPQEKFDMSKYRLVASEQFTIECNSVGCVIGHCLILDNPSNIPYVKDGIQVIDFSLWSYRFTKLNPTTHRWMWCFDSYWAETDNTPNGAAKRIRWLVSNGLPRNWEKQMIGKAPLCYV